MKLKKEKQKESISTDDVKFLRYYYLESSDSDTDALRDCKEYLRGIPDRKCTAFLLWLDGHTTRAIGYYLGCSHATIARDVIEVAEMLKDVAGRYGASAKDFMKEEEIVYE